MSTRYETAIFSKKTVQAKCPTCNKIHYINNLNWTGRGKPRIFCVECNVQNNDYEQLNDYPITIKYGDF